MYQRKKGDTRSDAEILAEGTRQVDLVRARGVFIAEGYGVQPGDLNPVLDRQIRYLYEDSKTCIWAELPEEFIDDIPESVPVGSLSSDRTEYVLHPPSGEALAATSIANIERLRETHAGKYDVQIVISDGLNVFALTDEGHLRPYLERVRTELAEAGYHVAPEHIVVRGGRVRAGYRIGEMLYGKLTDSRPTRAILHVIGERPGSGHHAFSVYITAPSVSTWTKKGTADHNITKVVSGIADTALAPAVAATHTVKIVRKIAPLVSR